MYLVDSLLSFVLSITAHDDLAYVQMGFLDFLSVVIDVSFFLLHFDKPQTKTSPMYTRVQKKQNRRMGNVIPSPYPCHSYQSRVSLPLLRRKSSVRSKSV